MEATAKLVSELDKSIEKSLAELLVLEFLSLEKRYLLGDWEPASLDGGQFCEVLSRILYHLDSGNLDPSRSVDDCAKYIENNQVTHSIQPRKIATHFLKVIKAVYKFRSDRGAIHISPHYTANEMDAKLIAEGVRWCFSEFLRLYWNTDREKVASAIREICQFDVPSVARYGAKVVVLRTNLQAEEELLVLLYNAKEAGYSRRELGQHAMHTPQNITRALQKLESGAVRQVVKLENGQYVLTHLGSKRINESLSSALKL
jgi:hypothetical protein